MANIGKAGERDLAAAKEPLEADLEAAKNAGRYRIGQAAHEVESEGVRPKLATNVKKASDDFADELKNIESEGATIPTGSLRDDIRTIVAESAREDTRNAKSTVPGKDTGLVDEHGKPIAGEPSEGKEGSGEVRTPYGETLAHIEKEADKFLKEGGTVADWRNFEKYLKTTANSGTAEKTFPFQQILGAVKEHLKAADPRIADLYETFERRMSQNEDAAGTIYGQSDTHALGDKTYLTENGGPEDKTPYLRLDPQRSLAGRKFVAGEGEATPEAAMLDPDYKRMRQLGYGPELDRMQAEKEDVAALTHETEKKHQQAVADLEAKHAARLDAIRHELEDYASQHVEGIRQEGEAGVKGERAKAMDLLTSKDAQMRSQWPGLMSHLHPAILTGLGMSGHGGAHSAAITALGLGLEARNLAQPLRIRTAYYLPPDLSRVPPGLMGLVSATHGAMPSLPQDAKSLLTPEQIEALRSIHVLAR